VNDPDGPYLVNPTVVDARTNITTQLLADEGYAVVMQSDEEEQDDEDKEIFFAKDFEKKFFSEETNRILCKTFIENAKRDPLSGEIGKSIIFCVSRKHAAKITQILNQFADKLYPDKYQSDFAMQITSDVMNSHTYTINFQNNNLSGNTNFLENYKSSKTRVCVTVGMMTTGYDCEDILNIGLLRPIFSPTDFIQIKGRGTRTYNFTYKTKDGGSEKKYSESKDTFKLFDFFGNCEYFEEKFDYDEVIELPRPASTGEDGGKPPPKPEDYENFSPDPLKMLTETKIGGEGMKIDRMFFQQFEDTVKSDDYAREQYEKGNVIELEKYVNERIMNRPKEYYTWEKVRRAINADRRITVREILDKIFGAIPAFKTKQELIEDEFESFQLTQPVPSDKYYDYRKFFETYIADKEMRRIIEDEKFPLLGTQCATYSIQELKSLGRNNMRLIVDYIKDNVNVSRFES
jgi:type I restriction enzyme R subunit